MTTDTATLPSPDEQPRRRGINPVWVMIGVGILMLGAIALASAFRQPMNNSIQGGNTVGTGQLVASGERVGQPLAPGAIPPAFELSDADGATISLADLRGRPVVINFWATWCPPCRTEMPEFEAAHRRYPQLAMVGVNLREPPDTVRTFVNRAGYTWTFLLDRDGQTAIRYAVAALPTTIFVQPDGSVREIRVGGMNGKDIEQKIAALVSGS